jgi:two-component system, response regulator RegA
MSEEKTYAHQGKLLIIEDDAIYRNRLGRTLARRGFDVVDADSLSEGRRLASEHKPDFAIVDMRLGDGNGLDLVPELHDINKDMRVIILTGYGNIASAVAAIKSGAVDYIAKPAEVDEIEAALLVSDGARPPAPENPMSADRVRWEHIQRVYELCNRNVSETARRLNMHRRTLQRILAKRSPQ